MNDIEPFHVMALLGRAKALQAAGHDVIHLEIGEPDFPAPAPILAAGVQALEQGLTHYTSRVITRGVSGSTCHPRGLSLRPAHQARSDW